VIHHAQAELRIGISSFSGFLYHYGVWNALPDGMCFFGQGHQARKRSTALCQQAQKKNAAEAGSIFTHTFSPAQRHLRASGVLL
jgi:hypothetical protein